MEYETIIGIETHIEQNTKTKMFCQCKNAYGGVANSNCCEVCTAMPGALPTINRQAVYKTIKAGLATNCKISRTIKFDRKSYFYPDLAKSYQISQLYLPICSNGKIEFKVDDKIKEVRINRIHLEEDTGKLTHSITGETMIDFNRAGVPLMEIVTEPDFRSAEEVISYLEEIKSLFKAIGVSECRMERGQLRCDVNVSLRAFGEQKYGIRTEMKNLNSFKSIERAIKYEISRQKKLLDKGEKIEQETLRWDDASGRNYSMRTKEDSKDYRYFPEPDLLPIEITEDEMSKIEEEMPILPSQRRIKYKEKYNLTEYDIEQLTRENEIASFFEASIESGVDAKDASVWIQGEISKIINEEKQDQTKIELKADHFAQLIKIYKSGEISQASAREVLRAMWGSQKTPEQIIEERGLKAVTDENYIREIVKKIIKNNEQALIDYKNGNKRALTYFIGQVMKETQGKVKADIASKIILEMIS